jgi:ribosome maturation factor RimP
MAERKWGVWVGAQEIISQTVTGLGYDCVEVERSAGGLLRITIDWPWVSGQAAQAVPAARVITVEDCERVTRQLQFALEVEGVDYRRLEVASPGIDRPLRGALDFERFAGEVVDITLKNPVGAIDGASASGVAANRKKFRGTLEQTATGWQVVWRDEAKPVKPGARVGKKTLAKLASHALGFALDEIKDARLAPIVDFKGKPQPKI